MSALGTPVLINTKRAYWLSSIGTDVIHSTIVVDELDANTARVSTLIAENITASTVNVSSLNFQNSDVSGMYVSSIRGNSAFFSTLNIASDLSGGLGYVRFHVDASGVQVDGDPIRFDNLVYLTSTINIVQVSTLVDTDIFSQNGFFSTLSSGSLSTGLLNARQAYLSSIVCDDISGTNGSFDRLFVSSLEAIDISGVASGKNWSLYPTLNSTITFQPGNVLSNVGSNLYFAGRELTDISGGGTSWSVFPAFSTVQMANNNMVGISTLQFQDGGRLTSVTGNNLQYNGSNISYGTSGNAANWAQFPANANVNINGSNLSNANGISASNLALSGSNITNGNTFTNSLGVGGLSLLPIASITSGGDLSCRNIEVGDSTTSLADVNIYGANALPGDNALYVYGGTTLTGGLTAGVPVHGTEIGALPVAGIDTVRIDVLPAGMGLNSATYIQLAAAGAGSFAAGGALSLAGGDYVEVNTDDFRVINTTSGNQSTTLTVANIQMPPSVAASVPLQINNTAGGINLVGASGKGQIAGFSSIAGDRVIAPLVSTLNINLSTINGLPFEQVVLPSTIDASAVNISGNLSVGQSTITNVLVVPDRGTVNNLLWSLGLGVSTVTADHFGQRVWVSDSIIGTTNIGPIDARIINFSSIQSGTISTINLVCSTINGAPPGGGGGGGGGNTFSTLDVSQCIVSSLNGVGGFPININANGVRFASPSGFDNIDVINTNGPLIPQLEIAASTITLATNNTLTPSFSTLREQVNFLAVSTLMPYRNATQVDVSGGMFMTGTLELPLATGGINFDDGSGINYTRMMRRDIANNNMLAVVNTPAESSNNMVPFGAGEIWLTPGADEFGAARLYGQFPGGNFGLDMIDADGATLFEAMYVYDTGGFNYKTGLFGVSSIVGYTEVGGQSAVGFDNLVTAPKVSTQELFVSSINGQPPGTGSVGPNLGVSSLSTVQLALSTIQMYETSGAYPPGQSSMMNIGFGYDVSGFPFPRGLWLENYVNYVDNLDIGLTGNADGAYITSYTNYRSSFSELIFQGNTITAFVDNAFLVSNNGGNNFTLIDGNSVQTSSLTISSLNGNDPNPAYTNNLMLSTMELYTGSTTLMYWDNSTTASNINTSGYDVVVGVNGTYKVGASFQFISPGSADEVEFFFLKNDTPISYGGGICEVANNAEIIQYCEIVETLVNGDKIQLGCFTNNPNVYLSTINGNVIQSPAVILTAYKIA